MKTKSLRFKVDGIDLKVKVKRFEKEYTFGVTDWGTPVAVLEADDCINGIKIPLPDCKVCRPKVYKAFQTVIEDYWLAGYKIPKGFKAVQLAGFPEDKVFITQVFDLPSGHSFTGADFSRHWYDSNLLGWRETMPDAIKMARRLFPESRLAQDYVLLEWMAGRGIPKGWKLEDGVFIPDVLEHSEGIFEAELVEYLNRIKRPVIIEDDKDYIPFQPDWDDFPVCDCKFKMTVEDCGSVTITEDGIVFED